MVAACENCGRPIKLSHIAVHAGAFALVAVRPASHYSLTWHATACTRRTSPPAAACGNSAMISSSTVSATAAALSRPKKRKNEGAHARTDAETEAAVPF